MTTFSGNFSLCWFDAASGTTTATAGIYGKPAAEAGDWDEAGADSGRAAPMPGWLNGAQIAWKKFGKLKWSELFEHALAHARDGFALDPHLWGWVWEYRYKLARFPEGQKLWFPKGHLLNPGDTLVQRDLARTIAHVQADETLEWFYTGDFAEKYVACVRADGGKMTLNDMARHRGSGVAAHAPVIGSYRGYDIHSPGAFAVALALRVAEQADLRQLGSPTENPETLYLQMRLCEEIWHEGVALREPGTASLDAFKLAGDLSEHATKLTDAVLQRIKREPSRPYDPMHPGTNALSIADRDGNVAFATHSCTSVPFGNGHIVDGVWLARAMMLYSQPTVLPVGLTTALLLAKDGKPHFVAGSPSISCLTNILQNTMNVVEFGMNPQQSVSQPMFGASWYPSKRVMIEGNFPERAYEHLTRRGMGHRRVSPNECEMGSCHSILFDRAANVMHGAADPRRRGQAAGF